MKLDYHIVYSSRRKKLTITVERDRSIIVKAPEGTSPETIQKIVESRKEWLYHKIHHTSKYQPLDPPGKELVNGESLLYLGHPYPLKLVDTVAEVQFVENHFLVPQKQTQKRGEVFKNWYIQEAKAQIIPRVEYYAQRLGVTYNWSLD